MPREVTVSITYDMSDERLYDMNGLAKELEDWLKGKITMPDVVHGQIAFHYTRTKAWSTDGSIISIKGGMVLDRKPLSVEEVQRLAAGNWSGKWWW
jgi:hypothetical protein